MRILLVALSLMIASNCNACLLTNQLKLFPIGTYQNQVVSVDIEINRWSPNIKDSIVVAWTLKTRISFYDLDQNLISSSLIDSLVHYGKDYLIPLESSHSKAIKMTLEKYDTIELFELKYLSYCDYQKECELLKIKYDEKTKRPVGVYEGKEYQFKFLQDEKNYFLVSPYIEQFPEFPISSVRVYETNNIKLIIAHLGSPENLPALASLPKVEVKKEILGLDVLDFVYIEPLNHHSYGLDLFFTVKTDQ